MKRTLGVPTGFIDLDRLLGGLQSSDFLIIAGRPGTGKTSFMLSVAKNAALIHKKHIAIFNMEMSNEQLAQRLIAQETGIDSHHLRTGRLTDDEWSLFAQAIEVLNDTMIFLDDTPGLTPIQLRTKCRRLHMEFNLDLILVDYLQLMSGGVRSENRTQEVSFISRNMKILARELNVPVLAAAQLSRAIEQRADKEPQLSDLRESGSLEQIQMWSCLSTARNCTKKTRSSATWCRSKSPNTAMDRSGISSWSSAKTLPNLKMLLLKSSTCGRSSHDLSRFS